MCRPPPCGPPAARPAGGAARRLPAAAACRRLPAPGGEDRSLAAPLQSQIQVEIDHFRTDPEKRSWLFEISRVKWSRSRLRIGLRA